MHGCGLLEAHNIRLAPCNSKSDGLHGCLALDLMHLLCAGSKIQKAKLNNTIDGPTFRLKFSFFVSLGAPKQNNEPKGTAIAKIIGSVSEFRR